MVLGQRSISVAMIYGEYSIIDLVIGIYTKLNKSEQTETEATSRKKASQHRLTELEGKMPADSAGVQGFCECIKSIFEHVYHTP